MLRKAAYRKANFSFNAHTEVHEVSNCLLLQPITHWTVIQVGIFYLLVHRAGHCFPISHFKSSQYLSSISSVTELHLTGVMGTIHSRPEQIFDSSQSFIPNRSDNIIFIDENPSKELPAIRTSWTKNVFAVQYHRFFKRRSNGHIGSSDIPGRKEMYWFFNIDSLMLALRWEEFYLICQQIQAATYLRILVPVQYKSPRQAPH